MIKLDDICFAYDSTPVLKHFSTEVANGEFVVIKGDNGCGKSTLLNIINALLNLLKSELTPLTAP